MTKAGIQAIRRLFVGTVFSVMRSIVDAAYRLTAAPIERVHDGADTLVKLRRYPEEQLRYVSELPFDVRLVLCMWVMDCDLSDKLAQRALT